MPGPYINQAPVDDSTDMGNDNARPRGTDPQTMGLLQRILSLLEQQASAPPMPPGMPPGLPGLGDPGMGMGGPPPGLPGMGNPLGTGGMERGLGGMPPPPMPGPGMPPPMPSPGMPPGMPPMPGGGPPGGGMGSPPMPMPNLAGTGGPGPNSPFARYAAQKLQGMQRPPLGM